MVANTTVCLQALWCLIWRAIFSCLYGCGPWNILPGHWRDFGCPRFLPHCHGNRPVPLSCFIFVVLEVQLNGWPMGQGSVSLILSERCLLMLYPHVIRCPHTWWMFILWWLSALTVCCGNGSLQSYLKNESFKTFEITLIALSIMTRCYVALSALRNAAWRWRFPVWIKIWFLDHVPFKLKSNIFCSKQVIHQNWTLSTQWKNL